MKLHEFIDTVDTVPQTGVETKDNIQEFLKQFLKVTVFNTETEIGKGMRRFNEPPSQQYAFLFVFKKEGIYPFTTLGMKFPINIYFFDKYGNFVEKFDDVQPDTNMIEPKSPFIYVVEFSSNK